MTRHRGENLVGNYRKDLAYIHDVGFGGFAANESQALLEILTRNGIAMGLVVDLRCGSGICSPTVKRATEL